MADPAAPTSPAAVPPIPAGVTTRPRRRRRRVAGGLLGAVAGLAVLGFGVARIGAGVLPDAGRLPTGDASQVAVAGPSASAAPSTSAVATATPTADPAASPSASAPVPTASAPLPTTPEERAALAARLQTTLDRYRGRLSIPGVSATIVMPDGTTWAGVSGLADVGTKTPVTRETAFAYASASKTFTSALILALVSEGRLGLDDSAVSLLPPLAIKVDRRITVRMLLDHTSGLADYFLNPKIDGPLQKRPTAAWPVARTLKYVGKRLSAPGAAWHYSNTNYLLLGLIAERLTGEPLADAIRERLLDPVGLHRTWYQGAETARDPLAHGYRLTGTGAKTRAIDLDDGSGVAPFRSVVTAAAGAGSIAGTSGDLATWARALYTGRVLGPVASSMLLSDFRPTKGYITNVLYGYGVQALSIAHHPSLGHSGRFLGFRSVVRHFPLDGLTISVLTNQSRADPGVILRALLLTVVPPTPACTGCSTER